VLASELNNEAKDATEKYVARNLGRFEDRGMLTSLPMDKVHMVDKVNKVDMVNKVDEIKKVEKVNKDSKPGRSKTWSTG
jgi:hypothetical protein